MTEVDQREAELPVFIMRSNTHIQNDSPKHERLSYIIVTLTTNYWIYLNLLVKIWRPSLHSCFRKTSWLEALWGWLTREWMSVPGLWAGRRRRRWWCRRWGWGWWRPCVQCSRQAWCSTRRTAPAPWTPVRSGGPWRRASLKGQTCALNTYLLCKYICKSLTSIKANPSM